MKNILRTVLVLFVLSNCIAIFITRSPKRMQKDHLVNNVESYHHGLYDYLTKDGDLRTITVEYSLPNKNDIEELEPILRNNIRNFVIQYNSEELMVPGNCADSLLCIIRNTLFKSGMVPIYKVMIKK